MRGGMRYDFKKPKFHEAKKQKKGDEIRVSTQKKSHAIYVSPLVVTQQRHFIRATRNDAR